MMVANQDSSRQERESSGGVDCFKVMIIDELHRPFPTEQSTRKDNDYVIFDAIEESYGVYIFLDENSRPEYVGEAFDQTLRNRITQNYTKSSGGTFRDNWSCQNGGDCIEKGDSDAVKKQKRARNLTILRDKYLGKGKLALIFLESRPTKDQCHWIHVLEKALIGFLDPTYNKE